MVYLHFPSNLTEEELMLQGKYTKLKKKKKALVKQKAPKSEPERLPVKVSKGPKMEARDAREVAKKLLKSGAISPIVKTQNRPNNEGFKRPSRFRALDRKPTEEAAVTNYQPFASSPADDHPDDTSKSSSFTPKIKSLYDNFVSERTLEKNNSGTLKKTEFEKTDRPRQGNTIFVLVSKITKELLQRTFSSYGDIVDISMESDKNRGFVTFQRSESADRAIKEMDGQMVSGNIMKATIARRQVVNPSTESPDQGDWRNIATTYNNKGSYSDKRQVVTYDDNLFD